MTPTWEILKNFKLFSWYIFKLKNFFKFLAKFFLQWTANSNNIYNKQSTPINIFITAHTLLTSFDFINKYSSLNCHIHAAVESIHQFDHGVLLINKHSEWIFLFSQTVEMKPQQCSTTIFANTRAAGSLIIELNFFLLPFTTPSHHPHGI